MNSKPRHFQKKKYLNQKNFINLLGILYLPIRNVYFKYLFIYLKLRQADLKLTKLHLPGPPSAGIKGSCEHAGLEKSIF